MSNEFENYKTFIETAPDAVIVVDGKGIIVATNNQVSNIFGYLPNELVQQSLHILLPHDVKNHHSTLVEQYNRNPSKRVMGEASDLQGLRKDGSLCPLGIMLSPISLDKVNYTAAFIRDITSHKTLLQALQTALESEKKLANSDPLTNVANVRGFTSILKKEIDRTNRNEQPFSLVYIDIDNFKMVNDKLGHKSGDELLKTFTHTVAQNVRKVDVIARLGGDEFCLLFPETDRGETMKITQKLKSLLTKEMKKNQWQVSFSFGLLTCHKPLESPYDLIDQADKLMYEAKKQGKNTIMQKEYKATQGL